MSECRPIIIWRFTDGKPGHDKQSEGLVKALNNLHPCEVFTYQCKGLIASLCDLALGHSPVTPPENQPHLIIGAGHATHLSLLAASRATGGKTIVLMKPSLPHQWFDACLIPKHDDIKENDHVILTEGAINSVAPAHEKHRGTGLILLGGPSPHYAWSNDGVLEQIKQIIEQNTGTSWQMTTSRRTPADMIKLLTALQCTNINFVPHTECPPVWLDRELEHCEDVWVSADSVSMMYEAITAGARVGVIELEQGKTDKITRAVERLVSDHMITPFSQWVAGKSLRAPVRQLDEAGRCARIVYDRFISGQTL